MNKFEFLNTLRERLSGLTQEEVNKTLDYYTELIEDGIEEGMSEAQAVDALGNLEDIVAHIYMGVATSSEKTYAKPKEGLNIKETLKKEFKPWMWVLIILGSPIWLSLLIGAVSVVFSVVAGIFATVISLYAAVVALMAGSVGCIAGAFMLQTAAESALAVGMGMVCAGSSVLLLFALNWVMKQVKKAFKIAFSWLKSKKERRRQDENL